MSDTKPKPPDQLPVSSISSCQGLKTITYLEYIAHFLGFLAINEILFQTQFEVLIVNQKHMLIIIL